MQSETLSGQNGGGVCLDHMVCRGGATCVLRRGHPRRPCSASPTLASAVSPMSEINSRIRLPQIKPDAQKAKSVIQPLVPPRHIINGSV